jgi:hypothetical protein
MKKRRPVSALITNRPQNLALSSNDVKDASRYKLGNAVS